MEPTINARRQIEKVLEKVPSTFGVVFNDSFFFTFYSAKYKNKQKYAMNFMFS